jgi:flagellar biosynthesis protein FlhG
MSDRPSKDSEESGVPPDELAHGPAASAEAPLPGEDEIEAFIEPASAPDAGPALEEEGSRPDVSPSDSLGEAGEEESAADPADGVSRGEMGQGAPRLVMAIASGKGGVGKSLLAAGIGVYLAQLGKRVVLVDANLGSGNLHSFLGVDEPRTSIHGLLSKEVKRIEEVVAKTAFRGLGLIPGHDNGVGATNPRPAQKNRLVSQIRTLAVDYVIIDLGPGSDFNTLDLFLAADLHIVVTVPEPTAIESAFRLVKSAFVRKIRSLKGVDRLLADLQASAHCGIPTPNQIYEVGHERDPEMGEAILRAMAEFKPRLLVNMSRTRDDLELGPALAAVGRRHLALPFDYLGYVESEDVAWVTVRRRRPLLVEYPEAKVAKDIERVTRRILSLETKERPECIGVPRPLARQGHYEILGLHPGATDEEVRRAQRRVRRTYGAESPAIVGVVPPAEVSQMHSRIEEAYATLADPEKRHLYDQRVFPGGPPSAEPPVDEPVPPPTTVTTPADPLPVAQPAEASQVGERPPLPLFDETTEFTGPLLRTIREARGVELQDIADRTKISMSYLRAIEDENFTATPAPVYLRGFVKTVAKDLKLDPEQVARTYMQRYQAVLPLKA